MAALAHRRAEVFTARMLEENQEDGPKGWNAGSDDDYVQFNTSSRAVSVHNGKNKKFSYSPIPHEQFNSLP